MEDTGNYHAPVATRVLYDTRLYVSVINAKLVHGYRNNDLRCVKTDRKDALKLANYSLDRWLFFPKCIPKENTRLLLKKCYRQYQQYSKVQTLLKNNLISLLDMSFPKANCLFNSPACADGSKSWRNPGIANAFLSAMRRCLRTNASSGAESTDTISRRKEQTIFIRKSANALVSCQNLIQPSCSLSR